jgi:IPT/TIG domain
MTSFSLPGWSGMRSYVALALLAIGMLIVLPSRLTFAQQNTPTFSSVDPLSGKVNDEITVTGTNLGKSTVSAVFLSDDKNDYKAAIVNQSDTKIVMKVPQVKPGSYNVSYQRGNSIYIQPIRFTVE